MEHTHEWAELYRQIPWTVDDFDKDRLNPHRARYALDHPDESLRGQPHSDEDHFAKIPAPRPCIVVKCYGCDTCATIDIPAAAYKRIVGQLVSGELREDDPTSGNDLSTLSLEALVPELKAKLDEYGLTGKTGASNARNVGGEVIYSGLTGDAAMENDKRLRKQLGLHDRAAADAAVVESSKQYAEEGRKASTQPDDGKGADVPEAAPEVKALLADKETSE